LEKALADWRQFTQVALRGLVAGPVVHDARIAAICLGHGVRSLLSADRDFSRFPGIEIVNPLVTV
jgi:predicted nucleic acid-binding protein